MTVRVFVILGVFVAGLVPTAETPVSFSREIAPVLLQKCSSCHNPEKRKGGYQTHTFEALLKSGRSEVPPVTAGEPDKSELYRRLVTEDEDDRMPQESEPLSAEHIAIIRRWIMEGARLDSGSPSAPLVLLAPRAPYPQPSEHYPMAVPITALAFSPDGTELAASGYHEVTIWAVADGQLLRRITNVTERVHAIAWHRSTQSLIVAGGRPGFEGELALYSAVTGELGRTLLRTADELLALALSRDGLRAAAGGSDNAIHIFEVESGVEKLALQQHADWVTSLEFSPDGKRLLSASRDRTVRIYDVETGSLQETFTGHKQAVFTARFTEDGAKVLSAGRDRNIQLWRAGDGTGEGTLGGSVVPVYALLTVGKDLFSSNGNGKVFQFSVPEKKLIRTLEAHSDVVYALAVDTNRKLLASGAFDGRIKLWDLESSSNTLSFVAAP